MAKKTASIPNAQQHALKSAKQRGFTLVEIIIAIAIIAILTIIGLTVFTGIQKKARDAKREADVKAIGQTYEVHFDPVTTTYTPILDGQFAGGKQPIPPEGGEYTFVSGPDSPNSGICNVVRVCSTLEGGVPGCVANSPHCFCYTGLQGNHGCIASLPAGPLPSPSSSPPSSHPGCPNYPVPDPAQPLGACGYYISLSGTPADLNGQIGSYNDEAKCNQSTGECWSANGITGVDYPGGNVQRYYCTGKIAECDNTHNPGAVISGPEYGNYYKMTTTIPCNQTEQLDVFDGSGVLKGFMVWYSGSC